MAKRLARKIRAQITQDERMEDGILKRMRQGSEHYGRHAAAALTLIATTGIVAADDFNGASYVTKQRTAEPHLIVDNTANVEGVVYEHASETDVVEGGEPLTTNLGDVLKAAAEAKLGSIAGHSVDVVSLAEVAESGLSIRREIEMDYDL